MMQTVEDAFDAIGDAMELLENHHEGMMVIDAVNSAPADHEFHKLIALAYRCTACSETGFVCEVLLNRTTGYAACPDCFTEQQMVLLEGGRA